MSNINNNKMIKDFKEILKSRILGIVSGSTILGMFIPFTMYNRTNSDFWVYVLCSVMLFSSVVFAVSRLFVFINRGEPVNEMSLESEGGNFE